MKKKYRSQFKRKQHYTFRLPEQFVYLCKLADVSPKTVLVNFTIDAGQEVYGGSENAKENAMQYFISCGYGSGEFNPAEMQEIMNEMKQIGNLLPTDELDIKLNKKFDIWRKKYYEQWLKKWYFRIQNRQTDNN